jgi:hypothetical protein
VPDISMCANSSCPSRFKCYRHQASGTNPTAQRQSYMNYQWSAQTGRCSSYTPVDRVTAPPVRLKGDKEDA